METKNESKNTILNVKIDFFTKIDTVDTKNDQKSSKIDQKTVTQNEVKFD